ncbi:MAG: hypothetical protein PHW75_00605 [Patescibacteria group bacterium]|nr:hypothetical protein [Patescibacteria group bacterium]
MKFKKIELNIKARVNPIRTRAISHIKSNYFRDTATQLLLIPSISFMVVALVMAIYFFRISEYLVPLRYNTFLGVISLGHWYELYQLPIFLTICFIVNILLAKVIYERDKFLAYIITASNIFLTLVTLVTIINFGRIIS